MDIKEKINKLSIRQKRLLIFFTVLLFNIILMVISLNYQQPYFGTVDDSRMRDIASGAMTGKPNGRLIFILYPLGFLISTMYRLIPQLPWYLIFMIGSIVVSLSVVLYVCVIKCKNYRNITMISCFYTILYILYFNQLILYPQFTSAAGVIGASAVFWYAIMESDNGIKKNIFDIAIFLSLFMLCYMYRYNVAIMTLPLLLIVAMIKNVKRVRDKKTLLYNLIIAISCIILIIITRAVDNYMYNTTDYKEYREFNRVRSYINDYYKMPLFDENIEFYQDIGITWQQYQSISNYSIMLADDVSTETLNKVVEFQRERAYSNPKESLKRTISELIPIYDGFGTFKWQPFFLSINSIILLILLFYKKKIIEFLYLGASFAMAICGSAYFIYTLRFPQRLAEALWVCNAVFILYSIVNVINETNLNLKEDLNKIKTGKTREKIKNIAKYSILFFVSIIAFYSCFRNNKALETRQHEVHNGSVDYVFMRDYARKNSENFYFYYVYSFKDASDTFGVEKETELLSWTSLGGWLTRSPLLDEKYEEYGFDSTIDALLNHDNVYIAATEVPWFLQDYIASEYPEYEIVVKEELNNKRILILSIQKKTS